MAGLDLTLWIPVLATLILAVGTLAFAYWQLRQNQRLHSATTLLDLRERFYSPRFLQARKELSAWLLQGERAIEPDNWEVGVFFQLLGSLTREGVLDRRIVRSAFGTWVTSYYTYCTEPVNLLQRWRTESSDPLIFADFEWLARAIIADERRLAPDPQFDASLREEARYVLESESRIVLPPHP
ncbi:MAG TPA: hypothetical protein VMH49_05740 [Thermoplasmata archaeon]|nr:hypothetical protein [Thermoplasmata archaeon]